MPQKLDHHRLPVRLEVDGCFRETNDTLFFISRHQSWHVTFVKREDVIYEELRRIDAFENGILIVNPELEYMYRSDFQHVKSYRAHLRKLSNIEDYRIIVAQYLLNRTVQQDPLNFHVPF